MAKFEITIPIKIDADIVKARQEGRALANRMGFSGSDQVLIATAISEAARNILQYARIGEIILTHVQLDGKEGIQIIARDEGPGIKDIRRVMEDGYSSSGGLGLGLPGIKRLMNEMEIESVPGRGTTVTFKKWKLKL
jgi:serine/threonine-protein kinase RsbT